MTSRKEIENVGKRTRWKKRIEGHRLEREKETQRDEKLKMWNNRRSGREGVVISDDESRGNRRTRKKGRKGRGKKGREAGRGRQREERTRE